MKKEDLAKAIKSVLAENTKNKLVESRIRQAIREVLAEELINEEVRDLVINVKAALQNNNPTQTDVETHLRRELNNQEKKAFGFIKQGGKQTQSQQRSNKQPYGRPPGTNSLGNWKSDTHSKFGL